MPLYLVALHPERNRLELIIQSATDSQASARVDQLNDQAKATREQCKNQIKQLFKMAKGDRAMKTQVETVKTRFTGLLNEHQVVEKEFRKKVKDRVERQYRIVNPQATEDEIRQVTESDNPQVFSQAVRRPSLHPCYDKLTYIPAPQLEPVRRGPRCLPRGARTTRRDPKDRTNPYRARADVFGNGHARRAAGRDDCQCGRSGSRCRRGC